MDNVLLTARDIANRLQISEQFAYALLSSGRIRPVRMGRRCVRCRPADLEAFVEGCLIPESAEGVTGR